MSDPAYAHTPVSRRLRIASGLTVGAGLIHGAAAWSHTGDSVMLGVFVLTAVLQVALGAALLLQRPVSRHAMGMALATNGGALLALVMSRTIGLPIGPGGVEPLGAADALTGILEVGAVGVLASRLWGAGPTRDARRGLVSVVGVAWLLSFGGVAAGIADIGTGGHHHVGDGHDSEEGGEFPEGGDHEEVDVTDDGATGRRGDVSGDGGHGSRPEEPSPRSTTGPDGGGADHSHAPGEGH